MDYKEFIESMKKKYIGLKVYYNNEPQKIVDIDYNGCALIDKPAQFTETTAVSFTDSSLRFAWYLNIL